MNVSEVPGLPPGPGSRPRVRDGIVKRGRTWSYVIRVKDPATGVSRPRWVGGFGSEADAKAARDQARSRPGRASTWTAT